MNPKDLLALLGRYNTNPLVAALKHYAVRNRPEVEVDEEDADDPVVGTQSWVKNSRAGIEFGFQNEAAWIGPKTTRCKTTRCKTTRCQGLLTMFTSGVANHRDVVQCAA